jgi:TP901 family phage tail tape measure protein
MAKNVFDADDFVNGKSFEDLKKTMESFFTVMDKGFDSFGKSLDEIQKKQTASKSAFDQGIKSLEELQRVTISQVRITEQQKNSMKDLRTEILKNAEAYQKYGNAIKKINDSVGKEKKGVDDLKKSYEKMRKDVEGNAKATKENVKATKGQADANVDLAKKVRELEKAYIAARQAGDDVGASNLKKELEETASAFIKIKNEVNAVKKEIRDQEKLASKTSTAYGKLSQEYIDAAKAAKNYAAELGETHPKAVQAIKDAKKLKDRLDSIDQSVGDFRRNVGNYKSALDGFKNATTGGVDATGMLFDALGGAAGGGGLKGALAALGGPYAIAAAGAVALGAGLVKATMTYANFEKEITRVGALKGLNTATEEGRQQMEALTNQAKELGSTTVFSASEAAQGMQFLAMAGFTTNDILKATPAVLNLASAAQIDMGQAADITSNVLSGMGLKADDAARVIDVLAKTTTSANTDMSQLGEAMKVIAPTANTLGISVEEMSAAIGILGDNGLQGTVATTALGSALGRLADPTKKQAIAAKELGVEIFDQQGNFVGLSNLVGNFTEATKDMTKQEKLAAVQKVVGAEASKSFQALLNAEKTIMIDGTEQTLKGADALSEYTKSLEKSGGAAQEMADTMNNTLDGAWKGLQSAIEGIAIEIGEDLAPIAMAAINGISGTVRFLTDMYKEVTAEIGNFIDNMMSVVDFIMFLNKCFKGCYIILFPNDKRYLDA